jgi:hypothetical protein
MNRLIASINAFVREWRRMAWLKSRRSLPDPFK